MAKQNRKFRDADIDGVPNKKDKPGRITKKMKAQRSKELGLVPDYKPGKNKATTKTGGAGFVSSFDNLPFIEDSSSATAKIIFEGERLGLISLRGIIFRVGIKKMGEADITVVSVYNAPQGTELADVSGNNTFVTMGQLHCGMFRTKVIEEESVVVQQKIYIFLRKVFKEEGLLDQVLKVVPTEKIAVQAQAVTTFKMNTLGQMLLGAAGYYDLGNSIYDLVVKLSKKQGKHQIEVAKISSNHPLVNCNVKVGFTALAEVFFNEGEYNESVTAFVNYVREFMLAQGVVKTFKKNVGVLLSQKPGAEVKGGSPRLATVDGKVVYGTLESPKALGRGFLTDSYGYWVTSDEVVVRCWSHMGIWFAKAVSVPSGHILDGIKAFIKISHLPLEEANPPIPGKELRKFLREKLREVGELN